MTHPEEAESERIFDSEHIFDEVVAEHNLDHERFARRGYPEAIFCSGKTVRQVGAIAEEIAERGERTLREEGAAVLFTRVATDQAETLQRILPAGRFDPTADIFAWPSDPPTPSGGTVLVIAAGTSDAPVAMEAVVTSRFLGRRTELIMDVGVAGIHRVLARRAEIRSASAIVVVAGMDGALPSVVAGLVEVPVVAVPTSVGYGASFGGVAALLSMLNACAPGVSVVNIDNGYGAAHTAAQIAARREF